ncbi:MAG TPA: bifunctional nicotinamidase/pyrazinamidase [Caldithrix abyssi]|uniref:Nicotinamidase n=1 Tax=Caldithrix abyssi TaxID=187145 RepID=A0A7V5H464_CALAY|nr:bifunctional nicotinamidase/pyrazinamidase [Caldisericaceae bacterium]HHE55357.1 bifunctional nicotinamidase/pyrazinamidase [Caldithrix abyssi]
MSRALILVDIQNDFVPGGALPVPEGDQIIPVVNQLLPAFDLVVATQDWHPQNHGSFASNHPGKKIYDVIELNGLEQILWPDHCVQGTAGADFVPGLNMNPVEAIFRKGTDPGIDSYSGFFDNGRKKSTGLADYLKGRGIDEVYVVGLAGEFCVNYTILDAAELGFKTYLIKDATRPLDWQNFEQAMGNMRKHGVQIVENKDLL